MVRTTLSVASPAEPTISESRPAVMCRRKSISKKRSWAATNPWARNRSSVESA